MIFKMLGTTYDTFDSLADAFLNLSEDDKVKVIAAALDWFDPSDVNNILARHMASERYGTCGWDGVAFALNDMSDFADPEGMWMESEDLAVLTEEMQ